MKNLSEMNLAMASDHAGFALKQKVRAFLEEQGAKVKDFGCYSTESCDYPDFAHPLADGVCVAAKVAVSCGFAELDAAAVKAALAARFVPAKAGNSPVSSVARLTLSFRLK